MAQTVAAFVRKLGFDHIRVNLLRAAAPGSRPSRRLRDELLNETIFTSLRHAREAARTALGNLLHRVASAYRSYQR